MALLMTAKTAAKVEASGNDLGDVCMMLSKHRRGEYLRGTRWARRDAQHAMRQSKAIRAICSLVMNPDDSVDLVKFGPRGGTTVIARIWDRNGQPI